MLTISNISKSYGGRVLFEDVSLQVNRGDKIGLVGPNGAGKTTLLSIILKEASPDEGTVSLERRVTMGYLPQETAPTGEQTALELAMAITPEMEKLQKLLSMPVEQIEESAHHAALARFDELGGYQLEARARRILAGLAFRERDLNRPLHELSGGWIMRAHLARLLTLAPDLLLLDEPTNHLDLESLVWFQEHLRAYEGAILFISHDREFLNLLCGSIVAMERGQLHRYRGNYDEYLVQRAARDVQQLAAHKNQQREIDRLQRFADRFRAKASMASRAQSKLKEIARMDKIDAPEAAEKTIHFRFPQPRRSGLRVISLRGVHHAYGENVVYRGIDFEAERGLRMVLVGPNGAGKSTLLKLLAGVLEVQKGERDLGYNASVGYYSQNRVDMLQPKRTVLEEASDTREPVPEQAVRTILGSFLFRGDDVFKPVAVLSGGEKSRLALVKLLLDPPNLLLMDEPTTHLDMPSIDALIGALKQYEGTLLFISHDVHFIRELATSVLHISAGNLTKYPGDYQYYLEKTRATSEKAALTAGSMLSNLQPPEASANGKPPAPRVSTFKTKEQKRAEAEERQARAKQRREREARVTHLETRIAEYEQKQKNLTAELESPGTYASAGRPMELNRELLAVANELQRLNREWELASVMIETAAAELN
jgi:ATP-binding cassette subfamily F protein 3